MSQTERNLVDTPVSEKSQDAVRSSPTPLDIHQTNRSDDLYRSLIENANDIIYSHDLSGNYISVNKAAEKLTGYSREELLSMNFRQIVDPAHLELIDEMVSKKVSGEAAQTGYEVDCIGKSGNKFTLEVVTSLIYSDGQAVAIEGIARDITERKLTEHALQKAKSE